MSGGSAAERVVALSGASSGLGLAAATDLARRGYRVVGGARRFPREGLDVDTLALDVSDTGHRLNTSWLERYDRAANKLDVVDRVPCAKKLALI